MRRQVSRFVVPAMIGVLALSCGGPPAVDECVSAEAQLLQGMNQVDDWRQAVAELVESAPPDSIVKALVMYHSAPTSEDRELLSSLGAVIEYEFKTIPAFTLRIPVGGLGVLADSERVASLAVNPPQVMPLDC